MLLSVAGQPSGQVALPRCQVDTTYSYHTPSHVLAYVTVSFKPNSTVVAQLNYCWPWLVPAFPRRLSQKARLGHCDAASDRLLFMTLLALDMIGLQSMQITVLT